MHLWAGVCWAVVAVLCGLDWYAVAVGRNSLERVAKPAATTSILLAGLVTGLLDRPWGVWVAVGLILGLSGDVMLLDGDDPRRFAGGLAAFLLGHLAYIVAFLVHGLHLGPWLVLTVPVVLSCAVVTRRVIPSATREGGPALGAAVAAYELVLCACVLAAGATGRPSVAIGGVLFAASDGMLAMDRFVRPVRGGHLAVMGTYLLAQIGIVGGMATT